MRTNRFVYLLAELAALASVLAGCGGAAGSSSKAEEPVHSVFTTLPGRPASSVVNVYSGIVQEAHTLSSGFKTAGQIASISVHEGDYVKEGQLIARLDDEDYRLGVEALQIQYDQVSGEVARLKELYEKKSVSANDYEKAAAGLAQLGVQLQVNKNKLGYTKLYSPVSGYIQSVNFSVSELVDAGTPVFTIMDLSHKQVSVDIPAKEYNARQSFRDIRCIAPDAAPAKMKVAGIVPKADGNQLYRMTLLFNDIARDFIPGSNVEVSIVKDGEPASDDILTLPVSAIVYEGTSAYVFIVGADSSVSKKPVSVGRCTEGVVEVTGLTENEVVVSAGAYAVTDGEKVKVIERPSESNVGGLL
ncbi:MAG: efflux RND transporter periplasmic adaptor subunit [Candidatus Cryptobacteroides sp.]